MKTAIQNNGKILALFAVACTAFVGLTYELTKSKIAQQEQRQLLSTLHSIIDKNAHDNDMSKHCVSVTNEALGSNEPQLVYLATNNEQPVAAAITTTAPDGYNGNIQLIVAVNIDGSLSGVRVLKHKETPGLGDKIETRKSDWVYSFNNKKYEDILEPRWAVKKDGGTFDQFTGATITPRAIVKAVKLTSMYFMKEKDVIFSMPNQCGEGESS